MVGTDEIKLPNDELFLAEDENDLRKLIFMASTIPPALAMEGEADLEYITMMLADIIQVIARDYHVLVASNKMEPFHCKGKTDDLKEVRQSFKDSINDLNVKFAENGVPLKEGEGGKVEIDIDKLKDKRTEGE